MITQLNLFLEVGIKCVNYFNTKKGIKIVQLKKMTELIEK